MDLVTIGMYIIGALLALSLIKFLIKLPFYLMTFGILGALGYAAYVYLWPSLRELFNNI